MRSFAVSQTGVFSARPRANRGCRLIARNEYFGKDGLREKFGGGGKEDLADLLSGQQPLDLGGGAAGLPDLGAPGEDDPLNYDPEGLYKNTRTSLQDGHISRRMAFRNAANQEEYEKELQRQKEKALADADERRAETEIPSDPGKLVDFFLNCSAEDIEYFIAKCRDQLDSEFFAALDSTLGRLRFLDEPDKEAIAELEGLRDYIKKNLEAQASIRQGILSATQRLQKLLTAKDKKQCILEMASANEIDLALMQLLQQNIEGARAAGREDVAGFMQKVKDAASKYVTVPARPAAEEPRDQADSPPEKKQGPTIPIASS